MALSLVRLSQRKRCFLIFDFRDGEPRTHIHVDSEATKQDAKAYLNKEVTSDQTTEQTTEGPHAKSPSSLARHSAEYRRTY